MHVGPFSFPLLLLDRRTTDLFLTMVHSAGMLCCCCAEYVSSLYSPPVVFAGD